MSRTNRDYGDLFKKDLFYGIFNASIIQYKGFSIQLKDLYTDYAFWIHFSLKDEQAFTKAGKQIWVNIKGDVGYGTEKELFESFTKHEYWLAKEGEVELFQFLKNFHNINPFDDSSLRRNKYYIDDPVMFKDLFNNDHGHTSSVGGMIYITPDFYEKILPVYFPGSKVSLVRNCKGDLTQITDYQLKPLKLKFEPPYNPSGYFNWDRLRIFIYKSGSKSTDDEI